MNWLGQLRQRLRRRGIIVSNPCHQIGRCTVDLSGFPNERLILDVDKLRKSNDRFIRNIVRSDEMRCDLIVFYAGTTGRPAATVIEAKGTQNEAFGYELKAVDQLISSHEILKRALDDCDMDLPHFSVTGVIVTGSLNSGAWAQKELLNAMRNADIDIQSVPSGWDVYRQLFDRAR